ncbi:MAG: response regulator, partial [Spirochaetota bacterium]
MVENHELTLEALSRFLDYFEYEYDKASNGREALELADRFNYDILVTDYYMPRMNGAELITHVKEKKNAQKLIVIGITTDSNTTKL